jgi:uncharacterized protein
VEKVVHYFTSDHKAQPAAEQVDNEAELLRLEKGKVKSAIRTDFILSSEIVVIALGTVMERSLVLQIMVVSMVALLATVGVYGLVAFIVRMDDMGFYLIRQGRRLTGLASRLLLGLGAGLVQGLPWVIRGLSVVGTVAMLLVGGGMFTHYIHALHAQLAFLPGLVADLLVASVVGGLLLAGQLVWQRFR